MTDEAFDHIMIVEGGSRYTNHPKDAGGPTKYGITLGRLRSWRKDRSLKAIDVKNLKEDEAKLIYKSSYWDVWNLDKVKSPTAALVLFDQCVNWGTGKSTVKRVQRSLNKLNRRVVVDGVFGKKTMKAINSIDGFDFSYQFICDSQDAYVSIVKRKPSQIVFLHGWINRTQRLYHYLI